MCEAVGGAGLSVMSARTILIPKTNSTFKLLGVTFRRKEACTKHKFMSVPRHEPLLRYDAYS